MIVFAAIANFALEVVLMTHPPAWSRDWSASGDFDAPTGPIRCRSRRSRAASAPVARSPSQSVFSRSSCWAWSSSWSRTGSILGRHRDRSPVDSVAVMKKLPFSVRHPGAAGTASDTQRIPPLLEHVFPWVASVFIHPDQGVCVADGVIDAGSALAVCDGELGS